MSFTSDPACNPVVAEFKHLASASTSTKHQITQDVHAADCILFVDLHLDADLSLHRLRTHPLAKKYPSKILVYDERDEPWCAFPGVYASMPAAHFDPQRQRAFGYYGSNAATVCDPSIAPDLLFSFVGSPGHRTSGGNPVRRALLKLRHPQAIIEDSTGFVFYDDQGNPPSHAARQRYFASTMARSKFVLCPRGRGTSSIRMYETLRAGRVPVVLADKWMAPKGPDWGAFTLRVAERDAAGVVALISAAEPRWPEMSAAAHDAYERWFAPEVATSHIFDLCAQLLASPAPSRLPFQRAGFTAMRLRTIEMKMLGVASALKTVARKR